MQSVEFDPSGFYVSSEEMQEAFSKSREDFNKPKFGTWVPLIGLGKETKPLYPKYGEEVLVTIIYGEQGNKNSMVIPSSYKSKGIWDNTDCGEIVIAWMPKPDTYKPSWW